MNAGNVTRLHSPSRIRRSAVADKAKEEKRGNKLLGGSLALDVASSVVQSEADFLGLDGGQSGVE